MSIKKKTVLLILLIIIVFEVYLNYIVLKDAPSPIGKDSPYHLGNTIKIIRDFNLTHFLRNPFLVYCHTILYDKDYPPLYYVIAAIIHSFFDKDFIFMTSTLFLILLIYGTYKIGQIIIDETSGLLSAAIVSLYPIIYLTSRNFNLELAQAAMVCLILYLLLRSQNFKDRKFSILFGFMFAIGMLIKQQLIMFIIGPLFITIFSLMSNYRSNRAQFKNLLFSFLIFSLISFIFFYWIYLNPLRITNLFIRCYSTSEINIESKNWYNMEHFLFYLKSLKNFQIGLFNLILFLLSLVIVYRKKEYKKYLLFFAGWVVLPFFILTLIPTKYHEYTISYLPALALITSLGILSIKNRAIKISLIISTLILNIFLYAGFMSPCYTINFLFPKISKEFLNNFKVSYTPASVFCASKSLDPVYKTYKFLNELLKNKKSLIGTITYPYTYPYPQSWTHRDVQLKSLLLFHRQYDVKNIIFDCPEQELDKFDIIVFLSSPLRREQWIDADYFLKDLSKINNYHIAHNQLPYFIYNDNKKIPAYVLPISQKQLERTINYFSKLKLTYKIADPRGDILIYKKNDL